MLSDLSIPNAQDILYHIARRYDGRVFDDDYWRPVNELFNKWSEITGTRVIILNTDYYYDSGRFLSSDPQGKEWAGVILHYPPQEMRTKSKRKSGSVFYFRVYCSFDVNPPGVMDKYEMNVVITNDKWSSEFDPYLSDFDEGM